MESETLQFTVGVDTGGTFTDVVIMSPSGEVPSQERGSEGTGANDSRG